MRWLFGGLLWMFGLLSFIAIALVSHSLLDLADFRTFAETASQAGKWIAVAAAIALASDVVVMTLYTIRFGQSENLKGKVITEDRPLNISLGSPPLTGRSKVKVLGSTSALVGMESLAEGTATFSQRMMRCGILTAFISFFFIFVGWGLMLMKSLPILVLIPILPGLFVYFNLRAAWSDYQEAKKKVFTHRSAKQATVETNGRNRRR
jgi:hypothetical protein